MFYGSILEGGRSMIMTLSLNGLAETEFALVCCFLWLGMVVLHRKPFAAGY